MSAGPLLPFQTITDVVRRLACSAPIQIYVGPEEKHYTLPKDLLCYYSPFFVASLNGNFKEAKEGVLRLPEGDPRYFNVFVEYMKIGTATFTPESYTPASTPSGAAHSWDIEGGIVDILDLVQFTDKYDIGEVASAAAKPLEELLRMGGAQYIEPDRISSCAKLLHKDNPVLRSIYRAFVINFGAEVYPGNAYGSLLETDDAVALGVMRQLQAKTVRENRKDKVVFELRPEQVVFEF